MGLCSNRHPEQFSEYGSLQSDEQQFLATVASVQSMTTDDAITQAWGTMKTQIVEYRTDLKAAFLQTGARNRPPASVNSSVTADQATIQGLYTAYWTAREKSRLDEFTYNDGRRTDILADLTAKGVDVTSAQQIETQIQALQPSLKAGLDAKDDPQLKTVNAQIDALCKQLSSRLSAFPGRPGRQNGSQISITRRHECRTVSQTSQQGVWTLQMHRLSSTRLSLFGRSCRLPW